MSRLAPATPIRTKTLRKDHGTQRPGLSRDRETAMELPERRMAHSIPRWEALDFAPEEDFGSAGHGQGARHRDAFAVMVGASQLVNAFCHVAGASAGVTGQVVESAGQAQHMGIR